MFRIVLFDIDGTLIPADGLGIVAFDQAFRDLYGIEKVTEKVDFSGRTDWAISSELLEKHSLSSHQEERNKFLSLYEEYLSATLLDSRKNILPGIHDWLKELKAREIALGLLTGNTRRGAETKLRHVGLWDWFSFGAYGHEHPDRNQLAQWAMERGMEKLGSTGCTPGEVLVIGDTPRDIACAHSCGAACLAVATGKFNVQQLRDSGADWVAQDLESLQLEDICRS